jgi:hypothetical protein
LKSLVGLVGVSAEVRAFRTQGLLVAEGFDRVEVGGFDGGVGAEDDADDGADDEAENGPVDGDFGRDFEEVRGGDAEDDAERKVAGVTQQVIDALRLFTKAGLAARDDAAFGVSALLGKLIVGPARGIQLRQNERSACIGFGRHWLAPQRA